jgi:hypothetical protein
VIVVFGSDRLVRFAQVSAEAEGDANEEQVRRIIERLKTQVDGFMADFLLGNGWVRWAIVVFPVDTMEQFPTAEEREHTGDLPRFEGVLLYSILSPLARLAVLSFVYSI